MTDIKRIQEGLAREGRAAYKKAKEHNYAFIAVGNSIKVSQVMAHLHNLT